MAIINKGKAKIAEKTSFLLYNFIIASLFKRFVARFSVTRLPALYPAFSMTLFTSPILSKWGSYSKEAVSEERLTLTLLIPSSLPIAFSTVATQAAHVMPSISITAFLVVCIFLRL